MASIYDTLLPSVSQTSAAGVNQTGFRSFNDLVEHGGFPVEQKILRVTNIKVWSGDRVTGIKPTYELKNGQTASQLRGRDQGTLGEFSLAADQHLVGMYGRRDSAGNIGSLSFVVFEERNGRVVVQGPYGSPPQPGTAFGTFGEVIALAGTDENSFGLCSLSVINDQSHKPPLL